MSLAPRPARALRAVAGVVVAGLLAAAAQPAVAASAAVVRRVVPSAADSAAVLAPVRAFVAAFNAAAPPPVALFTADAYITDDLPPFRWGGAAGIARWWDVLFGATPAQRAEYARLRRRMLLGPVRHLIVKDDGAYVAVPATMTMTTARGEPVGVGGEFSFTLQRADGAWRLSSHAWARQDTSR